MRELIQKLQAKYGCNLSESEIEPIVRQAQKADELLRSLHRFDLPEIAPLIKIDRHKPVKERYLLKLTVATAATLIRSRQLSPMKLRRSYLTRTEKFNAVLNAYQTLTIEAALVDRPAAKKEIATAKYRSPLHGIPISIIAMIIRSLRFAVVICFGIMFGLAPLVEARTINVAIPCYCFQYVPFFVAKDRGYYREEDLEVQLIVMGGGIGLRALIGGNVEFAATGEPAVLSAHLSGARLQILFTSYYRPLLWLYSDPNVKSITELKGKRIGVSGIGAATDTLMRDILKKRGIEGGREVTMLALGSPEARFIALKTGNVDAAVLPEGLKFVADEAGLHELISFLKEDVFLLSGSVGARENFIKSDRTVVEKFLRGTVKGLLYTQSDRSAVLPYVVRTLKVKESHAEKIFDLSLPGFTRGGFIDENLQREAYRQAVDRLAIKEPPPLERVFNYIITRGILHDLESKGWKP